MNHRTTLPAWRTAIAGALLALLALGGTVTVVHAVTALHNMTSTVPAVPADCVAPGDCGYADNGRNGDH